MAKGKPRKKQRQLQWAQTLKVHDAYAKGFDDGMESKEQALQLIHNQAREKELVLLHDFKWMVMHFLGKP